MSRSLPVGFVALGLITVTQSLPGSLAQEANPKAKSKALTDSEFLEKAAHSHNAEIHLGKLAEIKGTREDIKSFAGTLVKDHEAAYTELAKLLKNRNLIIVSGLEQSYRDDAKTLLGLSGADFDRKFIAIMVTNHEKSEKMYDTQAKNGQADDVKEYASQTLPAIRRHLEKARALQKSLSAK